MTDELLIYGQHYEKPEDVKGKCDPGNEFKRPINLDISAGS